MFLLHREKYQSHTESSSYDAVLYRLYPSRVLKVAFEEKLKPVHEQEKMLSGIISVLKEPVAHESIYLTFPVHPAMQLPHPFGQCNKHQLQ